MSEISTQDDVTPATTPDQTGSLTIRCFGLGRIVLVALACTLGLAAIATVARDSNDAEAVDRAGVDPLALDRVPERMWGVCGQNPAATQTPTLDVLVWDMVEIGERMFVGGAFTGVCENEDAAPVAQPYLAAFDLRTGDFVDSFTPSIAGAVYSLEVSALGSLLVGGEFTSVNGQPETGGLVALDPSTGEIDTRFEAWVDRPWSALEPTVRDMEVVGGELYIAGNFSHVNGPGNSRRRVFKAARLDARWGTIRSDFTPEVSGSGVWGLEVDPTRDQVHLVGFFSSVNGSPDSGAYHTVDGTTGASVDLPNRPRNFIHSQPEMFDVAMGGDKVWLSGEQHVVQILDPDTHALIGWHGMGFTPCADGFSYCSGFAGGAYQVAEQVGDVVYAGCHCTYAIRNGKMTHYSSFSQEFTAHKLLMAYDANTGELIEGFNPDVNAVRDGAWAVASDSMGCLWLGGDFHVGGVEENRNRWLGGFARLCPPEDTEAPSVPQSVTAEAGGDGVIDLAWTPSTDNVSVHEYEIRRDGVDGHAIVSGDVTSWTDEDVAAGETHRYRVRAIDFVGNQSPFSDPAAEATLPGLDVDPPSVPDGLALAENADGSITLTWDASSDPSGIQSYLVYRNGSYLAWTPGDVTEFTDTGVAPGAPVAYSLRANDTNGNRSERSDAVSITPGGADASAPSVPGDVTATDLGDGIVEITWLESTDDIGVQSYLVYRDGTYIGWSPHPDVSFTDTDRPGGVPATYEVRSVDLSDNRSERSEPAMITPGDEDIEPPTVPTDVAAAPDAAGDPRVTWTASTDNSGIKSYLIYRDGAYRGWATGDATSFTDSGVPAGLSVEYEVRAVDLADNRSDKSVPVRYGG